MKRVFSPKERQLRRILQSRRCRGLAPKRLFCSHCGLRPILGRKKYCSNRCAAAAASKRNWRNNYLRHNSRINARRRAKRGRARLAPTIAEKLREYARSYYRDHRDQLRPIHRRARHHARSELKLTYIRDLLRSRDVAPDFLPRELVELVRAQIRLHRTIEKVKNL